MERVFWSLNETHNMIAGNQLAAGRVESTLPARLAGSILKTVWNGVRCPVRIAAKLRAAIESHAPVGYEDETGFHYDTESSEGFFSI